MAARGGPDGVASRRSSFPEVVSPQSGRADRAVLSVSDAETKSDALDVARLLPLYPGGGRPRGRRAPVVSRSAGCKGPPTSPLPCRRRAPRRPVAIRARTRAAAKASPASQSRTQCLAQSTSAPCRPPQRSACRTSVSRPLYETYWNRRRVSPKLVCATHDQGVRTRSRRSTRARHAKSPRSRAALGACRPSPALIQKLR